MSVEIKLQKIIVQKTEKKIDAESIVRGLFGVGIEELVKNIQTNEGGKYDALYKE